MQEISVGNRGDTLSNCVFNNAQQKYYEDNGILVVKNIVEKSILEECRKRFVDICEKRVDSKVMIMKEVLLLKSGKSGEEVVHKIQNIIDDEVFIKYFENEKLLDAVSYFSGPSIVNKHSMLVNKPPKSGRHPPHQDFFYNPYENADTTVTIWTAVDDVDEENGCLYYIPGSHRNKTCLPHKVPSDKVNAGFMGVDEEELAPVTKRVNIIMKAGDSVFTHPYIIHGSGPNNSNRFRKAISGIYQSSTVPFVGRYNGSRAVVVGANRDNISKGLPTTSYKEYFENMSKVVRSVKSHI